MWWTLLALCVLAGLLVESYRRWLAVKQLWGVVERFRDRGAAAPDAERIADLNEATVDVGSGLALAAVVPRSCAKASLSIGALAALIQTADLVRGDAPLQWLSPAISFLGGCVGAFGCAVLGRAAEAEARRLRAEWAALIRRSSRDVAS
jgi:hypothetical protein